MITVSFCRDSASARTERVHSFDPHMAHLKRIMGRILLAAPLATADGAAISGDDRLVASTIVLDVETLNEAAQLMRDDPYTYGGVWAGVDVMECRVQSGVWATGARASAEGAYVALCEPTSTSSNELPAPRDALLVASLRGAVLIGSAAPERWGAISYFLAASIDDARKVVDDLDVVRNGSWRPHVWAVPKAIGSWTAA